MQESRQDFRLHCNNLLHLLKTADEYCVHLEKLGIPFTDEGFPVFDKDMFLKEWPDLVIPFDHRNSSLVKEKSKTVLCHFTKDSRIYPRLTSIRKDLAEYKKFMGVISTDITLTEDMDLEWQKFILLVNQLYLAVIASLGIKVVISTRCGSPETITCFKGIPRRVMCASSFLGCSKHHRIEQTDYLAKILTIGASKVILYGSHSPLLESQLHMYGIQTKAYRDYHSACKEKNV